MEIKLKNIEFIYKKVNYLPKTVFKNLKIDFSENISCIIGKNGSGKTTLLNIINGDLKPTKGEIIISENAKIGYVREQADFVADTVREELVYSMISHDYKVTQKRIKDVLIMVGLPEYLIDDNVKDLTNSQKKLLSLADAIIFNPNVLLLDNFTEGLDNINKKNIIKLIRILKTRYNKKIIVASNDIDFVHKIADKVYVLYENKMVLEGTKYEVFKEEQLLKKYGILTPNIIKFENLVLNKKGIKLGYRDEMNDLIKDIYRNTY